MIVIKIAAQSLMVSVEMCAPVPFRVDVATMWTLSETPATACDNMDVCFSVQHSAGWRWRLHSAFSLLRRIRATHQSLLQYPADWREDKLGQGLWI